MPEKEDSNPYHDDQLKTHVVDYREIEALCFDCLTMIASGQGAVSMVGPPDKEDIEEGEDPPPPTKLWNLYRESLETRLASSFLKLAVMIRTMDDQLDHMFADKTYVDFRDKLDAEENFGTLTKDGGAAVNLTLREVCNKIIHVEDFRPVYDNDSQGSDAGGWFMDSTIELTGKQRGKQWGATILAINVLEAMLELSEFASEKASAA
jgi:hypothetical protein